MFTFPTLETGELATVPVSDLATVEVTFPDGIFAHYIVRHPHHAGEYLYIGDSHSQACNVASAWNIDTHSA